MIMFNTQHSGLSHDVASMLFFNLLFWLKVADQYHLSINLYALCVHRPRRNRCVYCIPFSNRFPAHVTVECLMNLLPLFNDTGLNPGPANIVFVNNHFVSASWLVA